jgi:hypothetical protein
MSFNNFDLKQSKKNFFGFYQGGLRMEDVFFKRFFKNITSVRQTKTITPIFWEAPFISSRVRISLCLVYCICKKNLN